MMRHDTCFVVRRAGPRASIVARGAANLEREKKDLKLNFTNRAHLREESENDD